MALFKKAINFLLKQKDTKEVGLIEQYRVSRRFLEEVKEDNILKNKEKVEREEIEDIYFKHIWLKNNYQDIESQKLANIVFLTAIELGEKITSMLLSKAIKIYEIEIVDKAKLDKQAIDAINFICEESEENFLEIYQLYKNKHNMDIIIRRISKEEYIKDRISLTL